jgi:hypothetical protein
LNLENHSKVQLPFVVAQELANIKLNIAKKPYLADPQKHARLENAVKSFFWIVKDQDLFAEDIVQVLEQKRDLSQTHSKALDRHKF